MSSDLLECSICLSAFRNPHILPRCGHTFCLECIRPLRDCKCPICRQYFNPRCVTQNFVVQQLLEEGRSGHASGNASGDASGNSSGQSLVRPRQPGRTIDLAAAYARLGVPPKLAEDLAAEDADIALRVYILDNSGSMAAGDGHVIEKGMNGRMQSVPATRWGEVFSMALRHADWNAELGVPCEFVLLNSPNPANPQDGIDLVRIDAAKGAVASQKAHLQDMLERTRPNQGTPLTECIQHLMLRLRGGAQELQQKGQKVMVNLVTDGCPNGPRANFVQALRQFIYSLPAVFTVRLCTDDTSVLEFYDDVDKEVELALDILDDLVGEARSVYQKNPWLTYTPELQTVREAGTLSKVLDLLDERPLLPMEVAVIAQLLLRPAAAPQYPRDPDSFLAVVERDLANARPAMCGRTCRMAMPVDLARLKAAVMPRKYSAMGQIAQAVGMGPVVDWWFTGRSPWEYESDDEEDVKLRPVVAGHAASAGPQQQVAPQPQAAPQQQTAPQQRTSSQPQVMFSSGQQVEYYSSTRECWFHCTITQVDESNGALIVSVKPGHWISRTQQATCIRQARAGSVAVAQTPLAARPLAAIADTQAPIVGVPSAPPSDREGPRAVRPSAPLTDPFAGAELVEYRSQRMGIWMPCTVVQKDSISGNIMISPKPGQWLTPQQQEACIRTFDRAAEPPTVCVGDHVMHFSRSQGNWFPTVVTNVDPANRSIMVEMRPEIWIDVEQQKFFIRQREANSA